MGIILVMAALIIAIFTAGNIFCFMIGAKISQKAQNNETIELPKIDPLQAYRDIQAEKEAKREQDRLDVIMQNIDNYGTEKPQMDVPGR